MTATSPFATRSTRLLIDSREPRKQGTCGSRVERVAASAFPQVRGGAVVSAAAVASCRSAAEMRAQHGHGAPLAGAQLVAVGTVAGDVYLTDGGVVVRTVVLTLRRSAS